MLMPAPSFATRCVKFVYRTASALRVDLCLGATKRLALTASYAVSASMNARSALPSRMSFMLSTDAVVDCALAATFIFLSSMSARPAP